jgi:hypothetical protein
MKLKQDDFELFEREDDEKANEEVFEFFNSVTF